MEDYPYINNTGRLREFLKSIPTTGVPEKLTTRTLPQLGFKSSNDRPIVKILSFIGFIDANGVPTDKYKAFRVKEQQGSVMADALKSAYSELFRLYPEAYETEDSKLRDFFASKTEAGEQVIKAQLNTFKVLCEFATFEGIPEKASLPSPTGPGQLPQPISPTQVWPQIHINLQIHLPQSNDPAIYDLIFQAIAKHLLKGPA